MDRILKATVVFFSVGLIEFGILFCAVTFQTFPRESYAAETLSKDGNHFKSSNIDEKIFPENYPEFLRKVYTLLRQMDSNKAKSILRKLRLIVKILPLDDKIAGLALNDDSFTDFEDGLQYFSAIENNQDILITRNLKDFKKSKLPVMTAKQFIETTK